MSLLTTVAADATPEWEAYLKDGEVPVIKEHLLLTEAQRLELIEEGSTIYVAGVLAWTTDELRLWDYATLVGPAVDHGVFATYDLLVAWADNALCTRGVHLNDTAYVTEFACEYRVISEIDNVVTWRRSVIPDDSGGGGGSYSPTASTLAQRIADKFGVESLTVSPSFQMATMDLNTEVNGCAAPSGYAATPPKAYKKLTADGSAYGYGSDSCTAQSNWYSTRQYSGNWFINPATLVRSGTITENSANPNQGPSFIFTYTHVPGTSFQNHTPFDFSLSYPGALSGGVGAYKVKSSDRIIFYGDETCRVVNGSHGLCSAGPLSFILSDEDTDADALARAKAAASWSAWVTLGGPNIAAAWHKLRTTGWSATAKLAKIKGTIHSNIYGYTCRVSIPLYHYAIGTQQPSTPTSTYSVTLTLTDTIVDGAHVGVAVFPEYEVPIEQGYVNVLGDPTITLL